MKENGIPDLIIEKLLLGELPEGRKRQLLEDPEVRRRLEELKAENRRILEDYPPELMAEKIRRRSRENRQSRQAEPSTARAHSGREPFSLRRLVPAAGAGAAPLRRLVPAAGFALLVLVGGFLLVTRGPSFLAPGSPASEVRLKGGGAHLSVYLQTDTGARVLEEGQRVAKGNTLQVGYIAGGSEYGAIFSIDGRGAVTLHFPLSAVTGQSLEREGEVLLPFAYTLDDAPDFERFFFVVSKKPFSLEKVLQAAAALAEHPEKAKSGSLHLPRGLEQSSILLLK